MREIAKACVYSALLGYRNTVVLRMFLEAERLPVRGGEVGKFAAKLASVPARYFAGGRPSEASCAVGYMEITR